MNIDLDRLDELVEIVKSANISELTVRDGDQSVTIKKPLAPVPPVLHAADVAPAEAAPAVVADAASPDTEEDAEPGKYVTVTATMVGTFHLSEKPGGDPVVRVGQQVETGQVVCTIESMKLIHEVHSPAAGTVVQILVEDGQPVAYGSDLMLLETEGGAGS